MRLVQHKPIIDTWGLDDWRRESERCLRDHTFQQALDAVNKAIACPGGADNIPLLEIRSEALEKLGSGNSALSDAKQMVHIDKAYAKGYLRAGRILEARNEVKYLHHALGIYTYGLKHVPTTNKYYAHLKACHIRVERWLSPGKRDDPFQVLPIELALACLKYMTLRDLTRARGVSKGWKAFLNGSPELWTKIDLSEAKRAVPSTFIRSCITLAKQKVTRVRFNNHSTPSTLRFLGIKCQKLESLDFLRTNYGPSSFRDLVTTCRSLRRLKITHGTTVTLDSINYVLQHCPTLVELEATGITVGTAGAVVWNTQMPNLQKLELVADELTETPNVDLLRLGNAPDGISHQGLLAFTPNLTHLHVEDFRDYPLNVKILPSLTHLEKVHFEGLRFSRFPSFAPSLIHLHINGCHATASVGSLRKANHLPNLKHLHLDWDDMGITEDDENPRQDKDEEPKEPVPTYLDELLLRKDDGVKADLNECSKLQSFYCSYRGRPFGYLSNPRLEDVEVLSLDYWPIDDRVVEDLPVLFRNLKFLDLSHTDVTGVGIKAVIEGLPRGQLQTLRIDYCSHVSPDAIDYGARYTKVHFSSYKERQTGRRILT
ncbi:RNI-like protein [Aulographum hederae CBS 113979]|uniref:RNI-like protein n=1 Tax=Aulographum hederae CBS 113979 TaxID=1176131 RepID=A0A6G1H6C4_9PEZI|nr:RNI-like protein [Aulographum hederae CBS 113979]